MKNNNITNTAAATNSANMVRKEKVKQSMLKLDSTQHNSGYIFSKVKDEADSNLIRVLYYLHNDFKYQSHYFEIENTLFLPGVYRVKNNTFYVFTFNSYFSASSKRRSTFNEVLKIYPNIRFKIYSLKQYRRIMQWFMNKTQLITNKYAIQSKYQNTFLCKHCHQRFKKSTHNDQYCSIECAEVDKNLVTIARKNYFSGYYMDIHHFVRSGWEHNIAKILQWCQLDYNYENEKFRLSDGSIYIPDFYVLADDTYYEIKGELKDRAMKKIELFKQDFPDKRLIVINYAVYSSLIKQFPNINSDKHIYSNITNQVNAVNNINCFRHDNIHYEDWELNYEYYTNQRYESDNKQLIDINQAINILNITKTRLTQLVNRGRINYYMINNQMLFDKIDIEFYKSYVELKNKYNTAYINKIKELNSVKLIRKCEYCGKDFEAINNQQRFCNHLCAKRYLNAQARLKKIHKLNKSQSKVEAKVSLDWDKKKQTAMLHQNVMNKLLVKNMKNITYSNGILKTGRKYITLADVESKISNEYYHLIEICMYHKLDFSFETEHILLSTGQLLVLPLKINDTYYFCTFNDSPNMMAKVKQFIKDDFRNKPYIVVTKRDYDFMIDCFNNPSKCYEKIIKEKYDINKDYFCQHCGKLLPKIWRKRVKKYCSPECLHAALDRSIETECLYCHNKFVIKNKRDKTYKQFCSDECALHYKADLENELITLPSVRIKFNEGTCKQCGKTIYYVSNRTREFCCEQCRLDYTVHK